MAYPVGEILYSNLDSNKPVGVGSIVTFEKFDIPVRRDTSGNGVTYAARVTLAKYVINFTCAGGLHVVWEYKNKETRDSAYDSIISTYGIMPDAGAESASPSASPSA